MESENIDVQMALDAEQSGTLPAAEAIRCWVNAVLDTSGKSGAVCVRIVGRAESRELNLKYRERDRPTNVLSFVAEVPQGIEVPAHLGDLAVCAPIVADEAAQQQKTPADHWAHIIVHGVLHLLGYDHQVPRQADVMETLEVNILANLGVKNPYDY